MNTNRNIDTDLSLFFQDFPVFREKWKNFPFALARSSMKDILIDRISVKNFSVKDYSCLFSSKKTNDNLKIKVLFAHFSPFLLEVEGIGLPLYFKKMYPETTVDFTYDKGGKKGIYFRIDDNLETITRLENIEKSYDIIIARSSVLKNMMSRDYDRSVVENSKFKINIKTMSYSPNYVYADYYFDEVDMSPPVDPFYEQGASLYFENNLKNNLVVVPGTIKYAKGQVTMMENIDSDILADNKIVFLGKVEDRSHENRIREICKDKNIDYYLPGFLNRNISNYIKHMSRVAIFPFQPFLIPSGYPRSLGEAIASKNYSVVSDKIIVPEYYENCVLAYKSKDFNQMNTTIQKAINETKDESFFKNFKQSISFSDYCCETIEKILDISGIK